jgi:hypothetical protein
MIKITSKRNGFRRCGIAHSTLGSEYPNGTFSEKEMETLRAELMLTVEIIPDSPVATIDNDTPETPEVSKKNKSNRRQKQ